MARLSLMKLPAKIFYGLEFLGIAYASKMRGLKKTSQAATKSYMDFGRHDSGVPITTDFLSYAISLLGEVVDYSNSEQFVKDLTEVSGYSGRTK